jgi:hypothetical protein
VIVPHAPDASSQERPSRCFITEQHPGEIIFVPGGWAHEVFYHDASIALTGNYVDDTNVEIVSRAMEADGLHDWAALLRKLRQFLEDVQG